MMTTTKVWFVTGASKGLGLILVRKLLKEGYAVAATSRNPQDLVAEIGEKSDRFLPLGMDLVDESNVISGVKKALSHFKHIDAVVNNAGYGQAGTIEEVTDKETRQNYEVNVFGLLNVLRATLPAMRRQRSGHIFNISSIAGYVGNFSGWGIYCSTKFAVAGITESLSSDLKDLGIKVTLIYPGYFRTRFLSGDSLKLPSNPIEDYTLARESLNVHVNVIDQNQPGDPEKAAQVMIRLFEEQSPPLHMFLGSDAFKMAEGKMSTFSDEVNSWKDLGASTNF